MAHPKHIDPKPPVPSNTTPDICVRCVFWIFIAGHYVKPCSNKEGTSGTCTNCANDERTCIAVPDKFSVRKDRLLSLHYQFLRKRGGEPGLLPVMVNLAKDLAESIAEYEASENKAKAEAAASISEDGHRLILKCVDLMEKLVAIEADKMEVAERTYQMLMNIDNTTRNINNNLEILRADLKKKKKQKETPTERKPSQIVAMQTE